MNSLAAAISMLCLFKVILTLSYELGNLPGYNVTKEQSTSIQKNVIISLANKTENVKVKARIF